MLAFTFVLAALVASTHANDWNTPCTSGACGYDWAGDGLKTAFSSMMLAGPDQVLSDITPAAGWQILGCDPNWSSGSHDIRMVCSGTPEQMAQCNHLYDNGGAEETVVRLPQNCGAGPFARVQKTYVPSDQSVPSNLTKRLLLPAGGGGGGAPPTNSTPPAVRGLTLDYDFKSIPSSRGKLVMAIASSNVGTKPLTRRDLTNLRKRGRAGGLARRGFFDDIGNGIKGAFDDAKSVAVGAVDDVTSVAGNAINAATSAIESVATAAATAVVNGVNDVKAATTVNKTQNSAVIPVTFDKTFTLLDANINCDVGKVSGSASLHIDVDTNVNANIQFGYTFVGSIVPLQLDDVAVFGSLSGDAAATFNIQAEAEGTFDTGSLALFKSGLPGLSIPGIAALGPEFSLNTELVMDLDVEAQMSVTADFSFPDLELVFPQSHGKSSGTAQPSKANPLKLSAGQPSVDVTGTVTAHLIPRIDLGIDIADGLAKASVFMDMDISGEVKLEVKAGPGIDGTADAGDSKNSTESANSTSVDDGSAANKTTAATGAGSANETESASKTSSTDSASETSSGATVTSTKSTASAGEASGTTSLDDSTSSKATSTKASASTKSASATPKPTATAAAGKPKKAANKRASESVNGCVTVTGAIKVEGGLDGALEPLFSKSVSFTIFQTQAQLLQKCFGNGAETAPTRRSISGGSVAARAYRYARAAAPKATSSAEGTENEISPDTANDKDKSKLSCSASVTPLGGLSSLI